MTQLLKPIGQRTTIYKDIIQLLIVRIKYFEIDKRKTIQTGKITASFIDTKMNETIQYLLKTNSEIFEIRNL